MPLIREATVEDCAYVSERLRNQDKQEIQAVRGSTDYLSVLLGAFEQSSHCFCIENKGMPIVIYGVVPDPNCPTVGIIWMAATWDLNQIDCWFMQNFEEVMAPLENLPHKTLWNLIDTRNKVKIKWLERCGFESGPTHPEFGPEKRAFQMFHKNITPQLGE